MPDETRHPERWAASPELNRLLLDTLNAQYYWVEFDDGRGIDWEREDRQHVLSLAHEHLIVVDANDAFARQYGCGGREDMLQKKFRFSQIFHDQHAFEMTIEAAFALGDRTADNITRRPEGTGRINYMRALTRPIRQGGLVRGFYGVQWDVTDDQSARLALEMQNKQLNSSQLMSRLYEMGLPIPEFLTRMVELIPVGMRYAEVAVAAIEFEGQVYGAKEVLEFSPRITYGILVGRQEKGRVHIAYRESRSFTASESAYIRSVAERVGGYINRAQGEAELEQTFKQAQARAEQEHLVRTAVDRIRRSVDAQAVMRIGLEELSRILGTSRLVLQLGTPEQLQARVEQEHTGSGRGM